MADSIRRPLIAAFAVLAIAGLLPSRALAAASPSESGNPTPALVASRHMTLSAPGSAYADVRIPHDVRLSLNYWSRKDLPTPRFSRGDQLAALVIASKDSIGMTWAAFRLPREAGVVQRDVALGGTDLCQLQRYCEIPSGDYRVFVVSKAATSVRLELKGVTGRSTISLEQPIVGEISGAVDSYYQEASGGVTELARYGVGFSPNLTGEHNFIFSAFWFHGPNDPAGPPPADKPLLQVGNAGGCSFSGAVPPDRYAPGCPAGDSDGGVSTARALDDFGYQQWGAAANIRPGPISRGYYAVRTGIEDPGFVGFWLDLAS
jgi:hypothetical protein